MNPHLESLGAKSLKRKDFLALLKQFRDGSLARDCWQTDEVKLEL